MGGERVQWGDRHLIITANVSMLHTALEDAIPSPKSLHATATIRAT